jgi:aminomethyltransferase
MKKSVFFDFLNRSSDKTFDALLSFGEEGKDYIIWNEFLLPQSYGDAEREYHAIRKECAVFDVSPIRKIRISGTAANQLLDYVLTRSVSSSEEMTAIYVTYCNSDGTLKDDSILYKFSNEDYLLMPSDIDHSDYLELCRDILGISKNDLRITECTDLWRGLAIQGPKSALVVNTLFEEDFSDLSPFEVREVSQFGIDAKVARVGFTADLGYEVWFDSNSTLAIQDRLEKARETLGLDIPGYGLAALEVCRLEGAFIVAGWDFSTEADPTPGFERSPFEVGLNWLVDLKRNDFVGKKSLLSQQANGSRFVLRQFELDRHLHLADGSPIYNVSGATKIEIGIINCSTWSWGLQKTIGNVSLKEKYQDVVSAVVDIHQDSYPLILRRGPFFNLPQRNATPAPLNL